MRVAAVLVLLSGVSLIGQVPPRDGAPPSKQAASPATAAALDGLPGGADDGEWRDPAWLDALAARATRFVLTDGQRVTINPKVTGR